MDASILVVGGETFLKAFLEPIRTLAALTVEMFPDPAEAVPLIQAQQPDVLVLQASKSESLDLCRHIKAQSRLAWIYCILLEDRPRYAVETTSGLRQQLEQEIQALEAGGDAYLQIGLAYADHGGIAELSSLQIQLLQTQIQVGLRQVHNHRELVRKNDLLSAIALSDPLTELNNRRAFEWELPRQISNARSRDMPISLLMLDVDYFKNVNDSHGHLVGDRALQLFAARLRNNLRFYDTPFRYGGEEFVVILSDTSCQESSLIAHRICRLISTQPFVIDESLNLHLTISAGAASLTAEDDARGVSLLRRADQNLLKAKSMGRNRAITQHPHSPFCDSE